MATMQLTNKTVAAFTISGKPYSYVQPSYDLVLTHAERQAYIDLIEEFALAKQVKDYAKADTLRLKLAGWQTDTSDEFFINMHTAKKYQYHSFFSGGLPLITKE